ncbi:MAG: hypothetical protein JOY54_00635 [Acidobacteriaceae bacterium]|nr:hypothetical protein [Acidobacteriaceae bacterium]
MAGDERNTQNDELRYSRAGETLQALLQKRRKHRSPPLFAAIFLIAAGVLLFLNSLGWLPVRNIWDFWPLIFVWMGLGRLLNAHEPAGRAFGIFFVCVGALILLFTLHVLSITTRNDSWAPALLFILLGFALLFKTLERNARGQRSIGLPISGRYSVDRVDDTAILGAIKRKLDTAKFEGGTITSFMGSVEIDLRRAQIDSATRSATIEVLASFASVKMRIPETWRLDIHGVGIFGVFEDKTISPNTGPDAPVLVVTGYSAFSSVEFEN